MVEYAKKRRRPSNYKSLARQNQMEQDLLEGQRCYGEFKFWENWRDLATNSPNGTLMVGFYLPRLLVSKDVILS